MTVIVFTQDGVGRCLYTEEVDLGQLGRLRVKRAAAIEFDDSSRCWQVRDEGGALLYSAPSRETCLGWEVRHFSRALEAGHHGGGVSKKGGIG